MTLALSKNRPEKQRSSAASCPVLVTAASKQYGQKEAIAPLSFSIESGECVAFLGPSGGGKTTLLLLLSGQLEPSSGTIYLCDHNLAKMPTGSEISKLVGMIHQQFDLVPNLSALQNTLAGKLGEWSLLKSLISLVWPMNKPVGMSALSRVGVEEIAYQRTKSLSGGEQQRVAIARLLVQDPQVILADEPVSSLDPARAGEVIKLLVGIADEAGKTLIASMHSVELAREYFSRLIGIRNGAVTFDLPSHEVTEDMLHDLYNLEGLRAET